MRDTHSLRSRRTLAALYTLASVFRLKRGERLNPVILSRDMHALRDALELAIADGDPELYAAAETLVRTLRSAPLPAAV